MTSRGPMQGADSGATVFVVDDDAGMRAALQRVLTRASLQVEAYASGSEFVSVARLDRRGCVLLDVKMPEMNGLRVQAILAERRVALPVIFLTGSADVPIAVAAMRAGAIDFIEKPFDNDDLVARVRSAIRQDERVHAGDAEHAAILARAATLTPREREVAALVVTGRTSKEIARTIGASHRTVEIHRAHVMEKMTAATLADLVRMSLLWSNESTES
jgi:FixJ family two-component response regulator